MRNAISAEQLEGINDGAFKTKKHAVVTSELLSAEAVASFRDAIPADLGVAHGRRDPK